MSSFNPFAFSLTQNGIPMKWFKHSVKPSFCIRYDDQRNMIGHPAISQDINLMFLAIFPQPA